MLYDDFKFFEFWDLVIFTPSTLLFGRRISGCVMPHLLEKALDSVILLILQEDISSEKDHFSCPRLHWAFHSSLAVPHLPFWILIRSWHSQDS